MSLSADTANLRAGPGKRYPVEWVYKRARLPLKIVGEFGAWRRVRDWSGTQGWMHSALLSGRHTVQVLGDRDRVLRESPRADAAPVARLAPEVIGDLDRCRSGWCRASFAELTGWVPRRALYGAPVGD
ncbi:SH3 domain-containing protein [Limimonas halophila]|uniref:SH3 domain-containing protein n=1 Tax=Limimonas halophila TaxID=1082479 RepID=UPI001C40A1D7|nr:SH3 domain-containing protein [Limimonas halophila]